jgi:hypothetical protein
MGTPRERCTPERMETSILGFATASFNFRGRGREINFTRGVAPFGGRGIVRDYSASLASRALLDWADEGVRPYVSAY